MAERRLAAIVFSDIVGYTALMAESEERGLRARTRHRQTLTPLAAQYGGQVVDENGDELVLSFSSALDAVNCSLAAQADLRADKDLQLRIGIHLGDTVFEGGRVYGDGVNVASRIRPFSQPGGVCVSEQVYDSVKNQPNVTATSLGDQTLKNVARTVEVFSLSGAGAPPTVRAAARSGGKLRIVLGSVGGLIGLLMLGVWAAWPLPLAFALDQAGLLSVPENPPLPGRPSIVVLPFANMSGEPGQEHFSDGMTEDLTNDLSHNPYVFVISRSSAFTYKGKLVSIEQVGRELGVQYVLEGSVRRADDRIRITAQLIDATSGFHVWSERYDRDVSDIFDLQSEISEAILGAVGVSIQHAERLRSRRKPIEDQTTYDLTSRGFFHLLRFSRKDNAEARRLFTEALERTGSADPRSTDRAPVLSGLGQTYAIEKLLGWSLDSSLIDRADELAQQTIDLDPSYPDGYALAAQVHLSRGESTRAVDAARRAVELHPNGDHTNALLGVALLQNGEYLSGLRFVKKALRLNPRAPSVFWTFLAFANIVTDRFNEAVVILERVREAGPDNVVARVALASIYEGSEEMVGVDHHDQAAAVVQEIVRVNPSLTAEQAVGLIPAGQFIDAEARGRMTGWLRSAGLP